MANGTQYLSSNICKMYVTDVEAGTKTVVYPSGFGIDGAGRGSNLIAFAKYYDSSSAQWLLGGNVYYRTNALYIDALPSTAKYKVYWFVLN